MTVASPLTTNRCLTFLASLEHKLQSYFHTLECQRTFCTSCRRDEAISGKGICLLVTSCQSNVLLVLLRLVSCLAAHRGRPGPVVRAVSFHLIPPLREQLTLSLAFQGWYDPLLLHDTSGAISFNVSPLICICPRNTMWMGWVWMHPILFLFYPKGKGIVLLFLGVF